MSRKGSWIRVDLNAMYRILILLLINLGGKFPCGWLPMLNGTVNLKLYIAWESERRVFRFQMQSACENKLVQIQVTGCLPAIHGHERSPFLFRGAHRISPWPNSITTRVWTCASPYIYFYNRSTSNFNVYLQMLDNGLVIYF